MRELDHMFSRYYANTRIHCTPLARLAPLVLKLMQLILVA